MTRKAKALARLIGIFDLECWSQVCNQISLGSKRCVQLVLVVGFSMEPVKTSKLRYCRGNHRHSRSRKESVLRKRCSFRVVCIVLFLDCLSNITKVFGACKGSPIARAPNSAVTSEGLSRWLHHPSYRYYLSCQIEEIRFLLRNSSGHEVIFHCGVDFNSKSHVFRPLIIRCFPLELFIGLIMPGKSPDLLPSWASWDILILLDGCEC